MKNVLDLRNVFLLLENDCRTLLKSNQVHRIVEGIEFNKKNYSLKLHTWFSVCKFLCSVLKKIRFI